MFLAPLEQSKIPKSQPTLYTYPILQLSSIYFFFFAFISFLIFGSNGRRSHQLDLQLDLQLESASRDATHPDRSPSSIFFLFKRKFKLKLENRLQVKKKNRSPSLRFFQSLNSDFPFGLSRVLLNFIIVVLMTFEIFFILIVIIFFIFNDLLV